MTLPRLALATLTLTLAACGSHSGGRFGPGGPGGTGGPSPVQSETKAAVDCRLKPYIAADGSLTRDALDKGLRREFATADTNGDGSLQKSEVAAINAARASRCESEPLIDWEGAGRMTFSAFAARVFTLFDRADVDEDGVATPEELFSAGRPARGRTAPPPDSARGPGGTQ